jgi:UPF0755 protein
MMRTLAGVVAVLVLVVPILALAYWAFGPGPAEAEYPLDIREGATLREIASQLKGAGVIRSPSAFELAGRLARADRKLRSGLFNVPAHARPDEIIDLLVGGPMALNQVTIPEGLTIWETASILAAGADVDSVAFVAAATDSVVAREYGVAQMTLEGYLFPETYDIPPGMAADQVLAILVSRALAVIDEVVTGRTIPRQLGGDPGRLVILASIVEAEARIPEERSRIAAVYLNRLRIGMRLEADPTVAYALRARRPLLYRDLEVDSPWNTYRVVGLPPTAISNPGRSSLEAVLATGESPHGVELYFVARGDGGHIFSRTLAQHERAKRLVRSGWTGGGKGDGSSRGDGGDAGSRRP